LARIRAIRVKTFSDWKPVWAGIAGPQIEDEDPPSPGYGAAGTRLRTLNSQLSTLNVEFLSAGSNEWCFFDKKGDGVRAVVI
jgi:hypothetical protein